ncbi:dethiobiotin synthase [Rhizobium lemnae]|uniref:ATP-dependent dethiobiotin synthetase BioD n=1 Tax=Rhizobium lemnae TaxID=1214924 RepID=A0ABV8EBU1_9HYPH|nr:dethiobiotin synthase [Rhizobium lemnae]MCJ8509973.1 dethiobiotin synthase [Rhizobium lemnae]
MSQTFVVTGTDTGVGKTVFSAALVQALDAHYWKPVQSGLEEETDSELVARLAGAEPVRILPEAWKLKTPVSPHLAAQIDGVEIDPLALVPPQVERPLVIEGAGGLLVPLTRRVTYADIFARWQLPTILCARTALGTINHTLLSLEAMRVRKIPILGVVFIGDEVRDSQAIISELGKVRVLGRLPKLNRLDTETLRQAFSAHFDLNDFGVEEV